MASYYTFKSFKDEITPLWSQINKEQPDAKTAPPKEELKRGFEAYQNAGHTNLPFIILGTDAIREDQQLLENVGTLATASQYDQKKMGQFLGNGVDKSDQAAAKLLRKNTERHLTYGSVMFDSNWWLFRNDMFMLGAIHGQREFHLASPRIPPNELLWHSADSKDRREFPRVLGRELLMLQLHNYTAVNGGKKLGIVFTPPKTPVVISYKEFREKLRTATLMDIKQIFREMARPEESSTQQEGCGAAESLSDAPLMALDSSFDDWASCASTDSLSARGTPWRPQYAAAQINDSRSH